MKLMIAIITFYSFTLWADTAAPNNTEEQSLCQQVAKELQPADILFLDINEYLFRKVAEATNSWTSHVGVAIWEDEKWMIYESVDPVSKKTPLCEFLKRTRKDHVAVRRMKTKPTKE